MFALGDSDGSAVRAQTPMADGQPVAMLEAAPEIAFASGTDSNSPAVWDRVDGRNVLHVLNSINGLAELTAGPGMSRLRTIGGVTFSTAAPLGGYWMEAVLEDQAGTWYGYYHNEMTTAACSAPGKVLPRIGAARSFDRGQTWQDLGPILEMPAKYLRCETTNHYFFGGVGDFSVMLDPDRQYLYLFYSQYVEMDGGVGVAVARMPWAARDAPAGQLAVFNDGAWLPAEMDPDTSAYVYDVATPFIAAPSRWDDGDDVVNVFWGPSVHWNAALQCYVMLLNQAVSTDFAQGGIYVSYARDLADPSGWSPPELLLEGGAWYPQVIGLEPGTGTDKLAGGTARFFMAGKSDYVIRFARKPSR